jgi:4-hydroxythreonine-4-phosphate dehydrogenase
MIYVTQGHEKGIGLEVFLKSFLLLSEIEKAEVTLVTIEKDFLANLTVLKLSLKNFNDLKLIHPKSNSLLSLPSSTSCLETALEIIKPKDILVTMPTSKNQLIHLGKNMAGYTEYFRSYFKNTNLAMTFKGINQNVLLITDHLALKDVASTISKNMIIEKTKTTFEFYNKYFFNLDEIIFSGINPHVGENGLLGTEDSVITSAIDDLKSFLPVKNIIGPFSGDTLHMLTDQNKKQLFVYMFHDQGLPQFKSFHRLIGLNITMGLPFLRLSVDHGTAFDLYGMNKANPMGMNYLFKQAFEVMKYVN